MKKIYNSNHKGFTLIELLVVVLIIGILSAVALPQYKRAVIKSRFTQAIVWGDALKKEAEIYYMANGEYPTNFEFVTSLPIGSGLYIKDPKNGLTIAHAYMAEESGFIWISLKSSRYFPGMTSIGYATALNHASQQYRGKSYCLANGQATSINDLCKGISGSKVLSSTPKGINSQYRAYEMK